MAETNAPASGASSDPKKEKKARERLMFVIAEAADDGYTLSGECKSDDPRRPVLKFTFRPALPEEVYQYRIRVAGAESGAQRWEAVHALLAGHLKSWSLMTRGANGEPVPLPFSAAVLTEPRVRLALGVDYLDKMVNYVTGYTVAEWEDDRKN